MEDQMVEYLPFHAINEFMIPEYRQSVIKKVLQGQKDLPQEQRKTVAQLIKKWVKLPGFRDASQAPAGVLLRGAINAFEHNPEFTAACLYAWSTLNSDIRQKTFDLLTARGWKVLPPELDRTKLPGFLTTWPKEETYEVLDQAYAKQHPDDSIVEDDIRLMIVWLAGRLPYQLFEEDAEEVETQQSAD